MWKLDEVISESDKAASAYNTINAHIVSQILMDVKERTEAKEFIPYVANEITRIGNQFPIKDETILAKHKLQNNRFHKFFNNESNLKIKTIKYTRRKQKNISSSSEVESDPSAHIQQDQSHKVQFVVGEDINDKFNRLRIPNRSDKIARPVLSVPLPSTNNVRYRSGSISEHMSEPPKAVFIAPVHDRSRSITPVPIIHNVVEIESSI